MRAARKPLTTSNRTRPEQKLELVELAVPGGPGRQTKLLGTGPAAAPAVVEMLREIGVT